MATNALPAPKIGKFKLTLSARMAGGANRADIVVREIEVVPNGREQNLVFTDHFSFTVRYVLIPYVGVMATGMVNVSGANTGLRLRNSVGSRCRNWASVSCGVPP